MTRHISRTDNDSHTGTDLPENVTDPRAGHDTAVEGTRRGTTHGDIGVDHGTAHDGAMGTGQATPVPGTRADQEMTAHDAGHGTGQVPTNRQADHLQANQSARSDGSGESDREPLVPQQRATEFGRRWDAVKGGFVDEPRRAVAEADQIVAELLEEMQELFHNQRREIEQGIDAESTSTEDLRIALRRYSSFFARLLSV